MEDAKDILLERASTHGEFTNVANISQTLKSIFRTGNIHLNDVQKESLDMIAGKISRILAGDPNEPDHWLDIEGYARLARERIITDD